MFICFIPFRFRITKRIRENAGLYLKGQSINAFLTLISFDILSKLVVILIDSGEVYAWGYGKACGNASDDVLVPTRQHTFKNNIVAVAGGNSHSMALSGTGPEVIKLFFMLSSAQLRLKSILLINVKMPTIVGILSFINRVNYRL